MRAARLITGPFHCAKLVVASGYTSDGTPVQMPQATRRPRNTTPLAQLGSGSAPSALGALAPSPSVPGSVSNSVSVAVPLPTVRLSRSSSSSVSALDRPSPPVVAMSLLEPRSSPSGMVTHTVPPASLLCRAAGGGKLPPWRWALARVSVPVATSSMPPPSPLSRSPPHLPRARSGFGRAPSPRSGTQRGRMCPSR